MLKDQIVMITGATRGIGLEMAKAFAAQHASVAVVARDAQRCRQVVEQLRAQQATAEAFPCNLLDIQEARAAVDRVVERFGRIDVLVNNAAWWSSTPFLEVEYEQFHRECSAYLESLYFTSQQAARHMVQQKVAGRIIHVASTAAYYGEEGMSVYCASKAAVLNLTRAMALELGQYGIRVNGIAPGTTITEHESRPAHVLEAFRTMTPMDSLNRAADIAPAAVFLASDMSRGVSGHMLTVDRGCSSSLRVDMLFRSPILEADR